MPFQQRKCKNNNAQRGDVKKKRSIENHLLENRMKSSSNGGGSAIISCAHEIWMCEMALNVCAQTGNVWFAWFLEFPDVISIFTICTGVLSMVLSHHMHIENWGCIPCSTSASHLHSISIEPSNWIICYAVSRSGHDERALFISPLRKHSIINTSLHETCTHLTLSNKYPVA